MAAVFLRLQAAGLCRRPVQRHCIGYNTGEKLPSITYWADGNYIPDALATINKALRDWRTGEIHPIEPKLIDLVYQLVNDVVLPDVHFLLFGKRRHFAFRLNVRAYR